MKALLVFTALVLVACTATPPPAPPAPSPVKITQLYTTTPRVSPGEEATICYGVEGAASVRIEPPVEELVPSVARCFAFKPQGNTYKLIARGKGGDEVSQSLTLGQAQPRPRFVDLQVTSTSVTPGQPIQFCFKAVNAVRVTGSPGRFVKGGVPSGDCLLDNPRQTTTYKLTVVSADGQQDTDQVTVQVKGQ